MNMTCKLVFSPTEIHKLFPIPTTFKDLTQIIQNKLKPVSFPFKLKYKDEEEEFITLSNDEDLQTAILSCSIDNLKSLKIHVFKKDIQSNIKPRKVPEFLQSKSKVGTVSKSKAESKGMSCASKITDTSASENMLNIYKDSKNPFQRCYTYPASFPFSKKGGNMFEIAEEAAVFSDDEERFIMKRKNCKCSICGKEALRAKYICLVCDKKVYCEECERVEEHKHPLLKLKEQLGHFSTEICKGKDSSVSSRKSQENILVTPPKTERKSGSMEKNIDYKVRICSKGMHKAKKVVCGEAFEYHFMIKNSGEQQWPAGTELVCINGAHKGQMKNIPSLSPGEKYEVVLKLVASEETGKHLSQWRLHYKEEGAQKGFGVCLFVETENAERKRRNYEREENKIECQVSEKKESLFCPVEMEELRKIYKLAETLNDMFPGDLQAKVKFVESCPRDYDIYKLVNEYLLTLSIKQY